jgi:hypothetical protein
MACLCHGDGVSCLVVPCVGLCGCAMLFGSMLGLVVGACKCVVFVRFMWL